MPSDHHGHAIDSEDRLMPDVPELFWEAYDTRNGRSVGMAVYNTEEQVLAAIESWRARDRRGGRPDLHDLMPHLGARSFKPGERQGFNF